MYVLVTFWDNYADEFDVQGFTICRAKQWEEYVEDLEDRGQWPQAYYFGTNEGLEWVSFEDYRRNFGVEEITKEEYKTLKKLFGIKNLYDEYGVFPLIDEPEESSSVW